jgi:HupE/UreJ protein
MPLGGPSRAMIIPGGSRPVPLNPAWYHAASGFVVLGIEHILSGIDHLLFLFCLIIPFRGLKGLIPVITAFTVAHSVTLTGSAFHLAPMGAWFPPFVETAIAASIVYMALENIVGADLRRRWVITGLFGLVHGFGFSYALGQQLQFAGSHLLVSLFSFNVGIEIGQLLVLALMVPVLAMFRLVVAERMAVIILSALAAHTAWHWMMERWEVLRQAQWPRLDAAGVVTLARWVAALLLAFGAAHLLAKWARRKLPSRVKLPERPIEQPERAA